MGKAEYGTTGFLVLPRLSFRNRRDKLLFADLMERASYKDGAGQKRGELQFNAAEFEREVGWKRKAITTSLSHLVKDGLIKITAAKRKSDGIIITVLHYNEMQDLSSYRVQNSSEKGTKEGQSLLFKQQEQQFEHKNLVKDLPEQLSRVEHVETFVDSQMLVNPISTLPRKLFVEYFNTVRLKRSTGRIAVSKATKIWDKLLSYWENEKLADTPDGRAAITLYALTLHIMKFDEKQEEYTYGIIRNTTEHEARQKMLKLRNQGGAGREIAATGTESGRSEYHQKRRSF
ncbi:hypothetical protein [uncultured Brevibacillus sp.]|uniref:hypothetical protein n=1 Tax=uncultured Brevibacillus sp. TaxID=169970 RepID=UPI002597ECA7|nr:hypothetical protein [uncultured Brevibacillus sp.]